MCQQGSSSTTWAKVHWRNISQHQKPCCVETPATSLKSGQSRTRVLFAASCLNKLLKVVKGDRAPCIQPSFSFSLSPVNTLPHHSTTVLWFLLSSLCSPLSAQWLTFAKRADLVFGYTTFTPFFSKGEKRSQTGTWESPLNYKWENHLKRVRHTAAASTEHRTSCTAVAEQRRSLASYRISKPQ